MKLTVLFFGILTDVIGKSQLELITNDLTSVELLYEHLKLNYPSLAKHTYKIAVNQEITNNEKTLSDGDEIAFLAPFAGG